ncbi:hypothetical protein AB0A76_22550 [Streptomyces exfoliatus]|uniref:Extensin n=1 Tax=Streptomyces exfoliatus TaxID=1905 RepID=A0ABV3D0G7_STREX
MADERYQWLDQEAAERLLRGEPVEAVGDHARAQAERLAGALDAARAQAVVPAGRTELPGEAAALAAFRKAAAERAAVGAAAVTAAATGRTEHADLGRVRLAPVVAPARRWGRSLRYGIAAAVAAVTVGGVAVAAGTGVLPLVGPAPTGSVTAGETSGPLVSKDPGIRTDPEASPTAPGGSGEPAPGVSPSAGTGTTTAPTPGPDGLGTGTPDQGTPKPGRSTAGPATEPGGDASGSGGTGVNPGGTTSLEKAVKACREYRAGKLDATGQGQLTKNLRGGETLRRYCDRILGGGGTGTPDDGGKSGDGATDGAKGDSDSDPDGDDRNQGGPGGHDGGGRDDERGGGSGRGGESVPDARDTVRSTAAETTAESAAETTATTRVPLPV